MKPVYKTLLALSLAQALTACSSLNDTSNANTTNNAAVEMYASDNTLQVYETQSKKPYQENMLSQHDLQPVATMNNDTHFSHKYRQLFKQNQMREQQIIKLAQQKKAIKQKQNKSTQDLNFYVRRLMQDLVSNLQFVNNKTPVAVTDFAFLDSGLQTTNLLGYQISESLVHEIHKFGIPIIDYKSTGFIRVTEQGDYLLTRNYEEVSGNLPIRYVFTGTLTKHEDGYLVNAKVLGVSSKAVVGSAQSFIPNSVANSLVASAPEVTSMTKTMVAISN